VNTKEEVIGSLTRDKQKYWPDTEDAMLHGLQKFVKLASNASPNVIELLFMNGTAEYIHPLFAKWFLDNRDDFLSLKCYNSYSGYAWGQVQQSKHKSSHGSLREKYKCGDPQDPYDSKYAMHTIRMMYNGLEIIQTGMLTPNFKDSGLLTVLQEIRKGDFYKNATEFYQHVESLDADIKKSHEHASIGKWLREEPSRDRMNELLIGFYEELWYSK
jgi:predicted nucleotidyltransferase